MPDQNLPEEILASEKIRVAERKKAIRRVILDRLHRRSRLSIARVVIITLILVAVAGICSEHNFFAHSFVFLSSSFGIFLISIDPIVK